MTSQLAARGKQTQPARKGCGALLPYMTAPIYFDMIQPVVVSSPSGGIMWIHTMYFEIKMYFEKYILNTSARFE